MNELIGEIELFYRNWAMEHIRHLSHVEDVKDVEAARKFWESEFYVARDAHHAELRKHGISPV